MAKLEPNVAYRPLAARDRAASDEDRRSEHLISQIPVVQRRPASNVARGESSHRHRPRIRAPALWVLGLERHRDVQASLQAGDPALLGKVPQQPRSPRMINLGNGRSVRGRERAPQLTVELRDEGTIRPR
jgi:hypothetical protein